MEFFKLIEVELKKSRYYELVKELSIIDENAVKIVIELIARKDATVIGIMNQEAKEVKNKGVRYTITIGSALCNDEDYLINVVILLQ